MEVFSIIIPVYNRPEEIDDLLNSLTRQTYVHFEVIVVDDGSSIPCEPVVNAYNDRLRIRYFYIENSGPGLARNQGVRYAEGEIVIVLDSDCIVPASYLEQVHESLMRYKVDAFGGADRAHSSFSAIQKAVNYSMTSFRQEGSEEAGDIWIHSILGVLIWECGKRCMKPWVVSLICVMERI